ncbi:unnamed protein product [marine sediment metagenome]|uniref:Uncharacterized protein n=1 Tax=marine sediment metagenome TaxID=412755 RepID=X0SI09_9ZZZZ
MLREEFQQRIAKEYRYAVTKMQEVTQLANKLFYFSVFFGEAQRVLNWEWNTDLALIHMVTQQVHTQINTTMQMPGIAQTLPIDWTILFDKLTQVASDLATYFEKTENEGSKEELYRILGHFAEIAYAVSGNGSYLYEKGALKL